jgi:hypothetical protein
MPCADAAASNAGSPESSSTPDVLDIVRLLTMTLTKGICEHGEAVFDHGDPGAVRQSDGGFAT